MILSSWLSHVFRRSADRPRRLTPRRRPQSTSRAFDRDRPALGTVETLEVRTLLTTLNVTTTADVLNPGDGELSLREAVQQAANSPGDDTIVLGAGTYELTLTTGGEGESGDLDVDGPDRIIIQGAGADQTIIDANEISRVLEVHAGATLELHDLTITGGSVDGNGGGIYNSGDLSLYNVVVTDNQATASFSRGGGIFNDSNFYAEDTVISDNFAGFHGGGFYNFVVPNGQATLLRTTIDGNSSPYAGGIYNESAQGLNLIDSTVSNNVATTGVGGIDNDTGTMTIINGTISGNVGGGILNRGGASLEIHHSTITNNSSSSGAGGVDNSSGAGTVTVANSVIAGNSGVLPDVSGPFISLGYNLIGIRGGSTGLGPTDLTGSFVEPLDPQLGELADNGGPTRTHAPHSGSPVIDAGNNLFVQSGNDQTQNPRIADGNGDEIPTVDIGSVEYTGMPVGPTEFDYGDADPSYDALQEQPPPRHGLGSGLYLGSSVDAESGPQFSTVADGDDVNGVDDEDGVFVPIPDGGSQHALVRGEENTIEVTASEAGFLSAWIDFNGNGRFDEDEQVLADVAVVAGVNTLAVVVPPDANLRATYGRFRISSQQGLTPYGEAPDGEVEDHLIRIAPQLTVSLNGPLTVIEGDTIQLVATGSGDQGLSYEWDLDNDGVFDDAFGEEVTLPAVDDGQFPVAVRVRGSVQMTATASTTVTILNADPHVSGLGGDREVFEGEAVPFEAVISDPGVVDTHTIVWDFGDGSSTVTGTTTPLHVYADDGLYTVTVTVTDDDGGTMITERTVTVSNLPPTLDVGEDQTATEGETVSLLANFNDYGTGDTHTATIDWGDGTGAQPATVTETPTGPPGNTAGTNGTVSGSHVYADNGVYTVTVTLTDDDGEQTVETFNVSVLNAVPSLNPGFDQTVTEGDTVTLDPALFNDPGTLDSHSATIDWGDGTAVEAGTVGEIPFGPPGSTAGADGTISGSHVYADNGIYTVTITVTDDDGGTRTETLLVTVLNADPTLDAGDDQTVDEGETVTLAPSVFNDLGTLDTHTATIDWGDGTAVESGTITQSPFGPPGDTAGGNGSIDGSHVYADDGTYTVTVTLSDDDGGTVTDTFVVTVGNVDPAIGSHTVETDFYGETHTVDARLDEVDVTWEFNDAGTLDTHTATIDWGDGTVESGTVTQTPFGPPGDTVGNDGQVSGSHIYQAAGTYIVTMTLVDDDGNQDVKTFEVVVRPLGTISGQVFEDLDGDGIRDDDDLRSEWGLDGWTVTLTDADGNVLQTVQTFGIDLNDDGVIDRTERGFYEFTEIRSSDDIAGVSADDPRRTYTVTQDLQEGWEQLDPINAGQDDPVAHEILLGQGEDRTGTDFGNRGTASLSGVNFEDVNGNGVQDTYLDEEGNEVEEGGLGGIEIVILDAEGVFIGSTTTNADGGWTIENLAPTGTHTEGTYRVFEVLYPTGDLTQAPGAFLVQTGPDLDVAGNEETEVNLNIAGAGYRAVEVDNIDHQQIHLYQVLLVEGQTLTVDVDAESIGSRVDTQIILFDPEGNEIARIEDEIVDGEVLSLDPLLNNFTAEEYGIYTIAIVATSRSGGYEVAIIGDAPVGYGRMFHELEIQPGEEVTGLDFGNQPVPDGVALPPAQVSGQVFEEVGEANGSYDGEDIAVEGATVTLTRITDANGNALDEENQQTLTVRTDAEGRYTARNLQPGTWVINGGLETDVWEFTNPDGEVHSATGSRTIEVPAGKSVTEIDFSGQLRPDVDEAEQQLQIGPADAGGTRPVLLDGEEVGRFEPNPPRIVIDELAFNLQSTGDVDSFLITLPDDAAIPLEDGEDFRQVVVVQTTEADAANGDPLNVILTIERVDGEGQTEQVGSSSRFGSQSRVNVSGEAGSTYRITVQSKDPLAPGQNGTGTITYTGFVSFVDDHANDASAATPVVLGVDQTGQFESNEVSDVDVFRLDIPESADEQKLEVFLADGSEDVPLSIIDENGTPVVLPGDLPVFIAQPGSTYFIQVQGQADQPGVPQEYGFRIDTALPDDRADSDRQAVLENDTIVIGGTADQQSQTVIDQFTIDGSADTDVHHVRVEHAGEITVIVTPNDPTLDPALRVRSVSGDPAGTAPGRQLGFATGDPDDPDDLTRQVEFQATRDGYEFVIDVRGQGELAEGGYTITIIREPLSPVIDPEFSQSTLDVGPTGEAGFNSAVLGAGDVDEWTIIGAGGTALAYSEVTFSIEAEGDDRFEDAEIIVVRQSDLTQIASVRQSDAVQPDGTSLDSTGGEITFRTSKNETYFIIVRDAGREAADGSVVYSVNAVNEFDFDRPGSTTPGFTQAQLQGITQESGTVLTDALVQQQQAGDDNTSTSGGAVTTTGERLGNSEAAEAAIQSAAEQVAAQNPEGNYVVVVLDPVDFVLTDPDGRSAGYTSSSGNINEFDGNAAYTGDGTLEVLVIPEAQAGNYNLELVGVGGTARGGAAYVQNGQVTHTVSFDDSIVKGNVQLSLDFSDAGEEGIPVLSELDGEGGDGDGVSVVLSGENVGAGGAFFAVSDQLGGADAENQSKLEDDPWEEIRQWLITFHEHQQILVGLVAENFDLPFAEEFLAWLEGDRLDSELTDEELAQKSGGDALRDLFWSGLGRTLLGAPSELFHLGEFLGDLLPSLESGESDTGEEAGAAEESDEATQDASAQNAAAENRGDARKQASITREELLDDWFEQQDSQVAVGGAFSSTAGSDLRSTAVSSVFADLRLPPQTGDVLTAAPTAEALPTSAD